ncbi:helix-turn-helix domain-containing protein [Paenibacillus lentus]|uniref:helix-turn-helix domain-containing protein n=1 Tax=Paenibacillus lentus TaxID=1338368 RepID=UPI00365E0362
METIGQRIKRRRKELGLTIEDIKGATGISIGTMSSLENDKYAPSVAVLVPLSSVLKVSIDWIVRGSEFHVSEKIEPESLSGEQVLSPEDIELLAKFHQLSQKDQGRIEERIEMLLSDRKAGNSSKESYPSKNGREEAATKQGA